MRSITPILSSVAVALTALAGCGPAPAPQNVDNVEPPPGKPVASATPVAADSAKPAASPPKSNLPVVNATLTSVGLDPLAMDRTADPCKDFYQFSCGGWLAKTEIPADEAVWVRSFSEIDKRNELSIKEILEEAAKASGKGVDPVTKKLGDYYGACMDEAAVEAAGLKPIKALLDKAKKVKDTKAIGALITELHSKRIWALFDVSGEQDYKDATKVIAVMDQSGLGLPDRDHYLLEDAKSKAIREGYAAHIVRMMQLTGASEKDAKIISDDVMMLETELAKASKTRVERREPSGMYNKIDRQGVEKAAPTFPWTSYFAGVGIKDVNDISVTSVKYFEAMDGLLKSAKPEAWQSYLQWVIVRSMSHALPKKFVDESFKLYSLITGQTEQRARWKRCVDSTSGGIGELIGQPFVKKHFGGESKTAAEAMVKEISESFGREVAGLDWMDAKTKGRAIEKLRAMAYLIGYPNKWRNYDFPIDRKNFASNVLAARAWEQKRRLGKIGKPVDREEWQMIPPDVNAYYDPQHNHMVFPAGILQPPFYDVKAAPAVNLGGIGSVMGHELTHGFDDEGAQFSSNGNLENWWDPSVNEKFKQKTSCVADQYSAYEPLPGVKLNGKLTLGENIADLGGVRLALGALRQIQKSAKTTTVADGLTEDQQFFVAYGQVWCGKLREEVVRLMAQTNPHSHPRFRVNGPVSDTPEFAEAFSCSAGTPMNPKTTCSVW